MSRNWSSPFCGQVHTLLIMLLTINPKKATPMMITRLLMLRFASSASRRYCVSLFPFWLGVAAEERDLAESTEIPVVSLINPLISLTMSGKSSQKTEFCRLNDRLHIAKFFFVKADVSREPKVGVSSTMKERRPVRIVVTDQAGFHVSG